MKEKSKKNDFCKSFWEDRDIIFVILSIVQALNLIYTITEFTKGNISWIKVALDSFILLSVIAAFFIFIKRIHKLTEQLASKPIPVCFTVGKTSAEAQHGFEQLKSATGFTHWDRIEGFSDRSSCLWPYAKNKLPPDINEWKQYIAEALNNIRNFVYAVQGNKVYHIAVNGPATLALGLGAAFGTKYPIVFYHFQTDVYNPVLNLADDPRLVKEALTREYQYKYFDFIQPDYYTSDTAVILGGASHDDSAFKSVSQYLKEKGRDWAVVKIHNKYGGNLKESDWIPAVRELFSIFQSLSRQNNSKRLHLFYSIPIPLSFGLGMALGPFPEITLYNFEKEQNTYYPVLKLNDLGITY